MKINKDLTYCPECKNSILLPKKEKHHNEWSLICENQHFKKCKTVFLHDEYQEIFKLLRSWHLNDYEIHDILKYTHSSSQTLRSIIYLDTQDFKVYKDKINALKFMASSNLNFPVLRLLALMRFKYKLYKLISIFLIIIGLVSLIMIYQLFFKNYKNEYFQIVSQIVSEKENQKIRKTNRIEDNKNQDNIKQKIDTSIDSDKDGLPDYAEKIYKTDPNKQDTDGDGYTDKQEIDGGYNPLEKLGSVVF